MIVQGVGALAIFISLSALFIGVIQFNEQQRATAAQALDQQRQDVLNGYLDDMSTLVLRYDLSTSMPEAPVRAIASARTLTAVRGLDGARKATLIRYLWEARLITGPQPIVNIFHADLNGAIFGAGANLYQIDLRPVGLNNTNFARADLGGADLRGSALVESDLSGATLTCYPSGHGRHRTCADLTGTYLMRADLSQANLTGADLAGAHLRGANLTGANLTGADLTGADLTDANLTGADLNGADLTRALLRQASYNSKPMPVTNAHGTHVTEAPTRWPAKFDLRTARTVCLDCS